MKKILIFSTAYFPFVGGAEVAVKEITDRLGKEFSAQGGPVFGWDMITAQIDRKLPKEEKIGNVNVYRIGIGISWFDKYYLAFCGHRLINKLHKKNNYDFIWSIMASYGGFAALNFKSKNKQVPFLLTLQEGDDPEYIKKRVGFMKNRFKKIFQSADYIQCISNFLASWAKEQGAECPIEVIPNGVDIEKFQDTNSKIQIPKLKEEDKILITTSRLVKKNAISDVIRSLEYLSDNIKFLVLGIGDDLEKLKNLVKEINVEGRVFFLGKISHDELPKYLHISDVFIRPSLSEGLGNSFLEAMAAGLPVIGTEVGGIPDFLKDGETGLFCEVSNPKSIAEKVELMLNNDELRKKIIENGKKIVEEKYGWEKLANDIKNIFNKLNS